MKSLEIRKAPNLRRMMLVVAMTACMVSHAFAAVTPKAESVIMHDRITLGDVFDGVTENADYYLAPAPSMGKSTTLDVNDLTRISDAFHLGWAPGATPQQVVIRRSSGKIERLDIQEVLQEKISGEMKGRKFEMELDGNAIGFSVPEGSNRTVNVSKLSYDAVKGTFKAVVSPAGAPQTRQEVSGKVHALLQIPVLKEPLRPGDVISRADIDYIDARSDSIAPSVVVEADRLVGQTPRRGVPAMKPLTASDIQAPKVVKKGDLVTMALKSSSINLTAQGRALDDGSEGDTIRVMNTSSKQTVDAVVTGPQSVGVQAPSGALSMNTL